jgi:IS30 family transposase
MKIGHHQTEIANVIGVHNSTINRGMRGYRPQKAHHMARQIRQRSKSRIDPSIWGLIDFFINQDWIPEQASAWFKMKLVFRISHEWIYQHILADKYAEEAASTVTRDAGRLTGSAMVATMGPNLVSIEQRPAIVDTRMRLGDWEVDTIIGKGHRQAIVTLTENKSLLALLCKVERKTAQAVGYAVIDLLKPLADRTHNDHIR